MKTLFPEQVFGIVSVFVCRCGDAGLLTSEDHRRGPVVSEAPDYQLTRDCGFPALVQGPRLVCNGSIGFTTGPLAKRLPDNKSSDRARCNARRSKRIRMRGYRQ